MNLLKHYDKTMKFYQSICLLLKYTMILTNLFLIFVIIYTYVFLEQEFILFIPGEPLPLIFYYETMFMHLKIIPYRYLNTIYLYVSDLSTFLLHVVYLTILTSFLAKLSILSMDESKEGELVKNYRKLGIFLIVSAFILPLIKTILVYFVMQYYQAESLRALYEINIPLFLGGLLLLFYSFKFDVRLS